jgi:hypothetical protein
VLECASPKSSGKVGPSGGRPTNVLTASAGSCALAALLVEGGGGEAAGGDVVEVGGEDEAETCGQMSVLLPAG